MDFVQLSERKKISDVKMVGIFDQLRRISNRLIDRYFLLKSGIGKRFIEAKKKK